MPAIPGKESLGRQDVARITWQRFLKNYFIGRSSLTEIPLLKALLARILGQELLSRNPLKKIPWQEPLGWNALA